MNVLFLYWILSLLYISKEQFVINPHLTEQNSNPIKYMIIYIPEDESEDVKENLEKVYQNSYIFSNSFFVCKGQTNRNYLLLEDKLYSINTDNAKIEFSFLRHLPDNIKYFGYIKEKLKVSAPPIRRVAIPPDVPNVPAVHVDTLENEDITFYGLDNNMRICFYNSKLSNPICTDFGITDINIFCKPLENRIYICAYSENSIIELKIFKLTDGSTNLQILYPNSGNELNIFSEHHHPVLYDNYICFWRNCPDNKWNNICWRKRCRVIILFF